MKRKIDFECSLNSQDDDRVALGLWNNNDVVTCELYMQILIHIYTEKYYTLFIPSWDNNYVENWESFFFFLFLSFSLSVAPFQFPQLVSMLVFLSVHNSYAQGVQTRIVSDLVHIEKGKPSYDGYKPGKKCGEGKEKPEFDRDPQKFRASPAISSTFILYQMYTFVSNESNIHL